MSWERARSLAAGRGGVWSLLVVRGGQTLFEERQGCGPDDLFYSFSVTKPFTALAVHLLAHRGQLDLDAPLADHWPGYARHGKGAITPRQVLSHSAGVPLSSRWLAVDMVALRSWRWSVWLAAHARPRTPPGAVFEYHVLSFGFILGELVRRVDGRMIDRFLADEFFTPLGLEHCHLALPKGLEDRAVKLRPANRDDKLTTDGLNHHRQRRAVSPASSLQATARDLADFYGVLLRDGRTPAGQVIPAEVIAAARRRASPDLPRFGTGFQLGGMGSRAHPDSFGHNGSDVCAVWADPSRDLVIVYCSDWFHPGEASWLHVGLVMDAVLEAVDAGPAAGPAVD